MKKDKTNKNNKMIEYDVGILGGMGPLASSYLYSLITKRTFAKKDQDHLNIIISSYAGIPDRSAFIIDDSNENPIPYLLESIKQLQYLGAKFIAIPCNTAHHFYNLLSQSVEVPIINMVSSTVDYLHNKKSKKNRSFSNNWNSQFFVISKTFKREGY